MSYTIISYHILYYNIIVYIYIYIYIERERDVCVYIYIYIYIYILCRAWERFRALRVIQALRRPGPQGPRLVGDVLGAIHLSANERSGAELRPQEKETSGAKTWFFDDPWEEKSSWVSSLSRRRCTASRTRLLSGTTKPCIRRRKSCAHRNAAETIDRKPSECDRFGLHLHSFDMFL